MTKARVDSLEVFKTFRAALIKFGETSMSALAEAESEVHRTLVWLETEQLLFWQTEIRKRHEWVEKCKEAYRQKTIFKDAAGRRSSGFDERKALEKAKRALEEAEEKLANTRKYVRLLQRELQNFTGSMQRFATDVSSCIPVAAAKLEKMRQQLEDYVNLHAPSEATSTAPTSDDSMSRGSADEIAKSAAQQWASLAPIPEQRRAAEAAGSMNFLMTTQQLSGPHRLGIATLNLKRVPPEAQQMVAISAVLAHGDELFLHRASAPDSTDSGWFIGPTAAERMDGRLIKATVEQLLAIRPDLREILSLPADFVVVIGAGTVQHVYNSKGEDLWTK